MCLDRSAASLGWVLSGEFPTVLGTISRLRRLSRHRAALRCLRLALPCLWSCSQPSVGPLQRRSGRLLSRRPHRVPDKERLSPPRFPGDPCVHALLFDPGGAATPSPLGAVAVAFRPVNDVGSALSAFEAQSHGLHAPCVRFAAGVTPEPRNSRFLWMANPCRFGTCTRRVATRGFRLLNSLWLSSPSSKLCLAQ